MLIELFDLAEYYKILQHENTFFSMHSKNQVLEILLIFKLILVMKILW